MHSDSPSGSNSVTRLIPLEKANNELLMYLQYPQLEVMWIESNSSLPTCTKPVSLKHYYSIICIFSHLVLYGSVLPCSTLLAVFLCQGSYKHCCTQLLKVLHKCCNTDMLGILLRNLHFPLEVVHIYQSNLSLLCYSILMNIHCSYVSCIYL